MMKLAEPLFSQIFQTLNDAVLILDAGQCILYANPAAERLLGYSSHDLAGRNIKTMVSAMALVILEQFFTMQETNVDAPQARTLECILTSREGVDISAEATVCRVEHHQQKYYSVVLRDISKHQKFEKALEASEAELRALFAAITAEVVVLDAEGTYLKIAPTHPSNVLKPSSMMLSKKVSELYPLDISRQIMGCISQSLNRHKTTNMEYRLDIAGEGHYFNASISPLTNTTVLWVSREITEQRRAEEQVQQRQRELVTLVNSLPGMAYLKDCNGVYLVVNDQFNRHWGKKRDVTGSTNQDFMLEDRAKADRESDRQVIEQGEAVYIGEADYEIDGRTVSLAERKTPILDDQNQVVGLIGLAMNVSELKQVQERLKSMLALQNLIMTLSTSFISLPLDTVNEEITRSLQKLGLHEVVDRVSVFQFDCDHGSMDKTHEWCADGVEAVAHEMQNLSLQYYQWFFPTLNTGNFIHIPRVADLLDRKDDLIKPVLQSQKVKSLVAVPMLTGGNAVGFVSLECVNNERDWPEEQIALLKILADIFASALERKRTSSQLRESEGRNRALLTAIPDTMFLMNRNGDILDSKIGDQADMEWARLSLNAGANIFHLVPDEIAHKLMKQVDEVLKKGQMQALEYELETPAGVQTYEARLVSSGKEEVIAIVRNVSERARLELMKSDFINRAAHELRTPLTTSLLMADLLQGGCSSEEQKQYSTILKSELSRQRMLVEDLLTVSRLENDVFDLQVKPVQLNKIIDTVLTGEGIVAQAKNVSLLVEVPDDLPAVFGDERPLQQVFTNLVDNAIKFTPEGGSIHLETQSYADFVTVQISDTGIGIPVEDLPHLFTRFYRASNARKKEVPGSGIGLFIVKSIVERLQGRIYVTSQVNHGTTFEVWLPIAQKPA